MYIVRKHYARVFGVTHQTILEGNGISTLREVSYDVLSRALRGDIGSLPTSLNMNRRAVSDTNPRMVTNALEG